MYIRWTDVNYITYWVCHVNVLLHAPFLVVTRRTGRFFPNSDDLSSPDAVAQSEAFQRRNEGTPFLYVLLHNGYKLTNTSSAANSKTA
jgi:hypothetical protein